MERLCAQPRASSSNRRRARASVRIPVRSAAPGEGIRYCEIPISRAPHPPLRGTFSRWEKDMLFRFLPDLTGVDDLRRIDGFAVDLFLNDLAFLVDQERCAARRHHRRSADVNLLF